MPSKSQRLRPRLCTLEKGDNGYGFHLHGEKGKTGQFVRLVEPDSPAEASGLHAGDRLVFVNREDVENESHQQVVSRIRATVGRLELVVVDPDTEQLLKRHNVKCLREYVSDGVPLPFEEEEEEGEEEEEERVDGTVNGDEVMEEKVMEEEVMEEEVMEEEVEEEEERVGTPRDSTPVPDRNGEIYARVEKKLSVESEKVSESSKQRVVRTVTPRDLHLCHTLRSITAFYGATLRPLNASLQGPHTNTQRFSGPAQQPTTRNTVFSFFLNPSKCIFSPPM